MLARNLLPALVPLLVVVAIALTLPIAPVASAPAIGAALLAYSLGFCVWASISPDLQRPRLGGGRRASSANRTAPRATVTWVLGEAPLRYYLSTGAIQVSAVEGYDWLVHEVDLRLRRGRCRRPPRPLARPALPRNRQRRGRSALHPTLPGARPGPGAAAPAGACATPRSNFRNNGVLLDGVGP